MTDREKLTAIRAEIERRYNERDRLGDNIRANVHKSLISFIDSLQEEPVSVFMNTESMIESYKQRLISQANGVKNSPLIDMCLASYKHGINETLDTLNLSNVQKTEKNWKELASEELDEAAKRYATEGDEISGLYIIDEEVDAFKAGAKWGKNQAMAEIQAQSMALAHGCPKEPVSENLGEYINELSKQFPEVSFAKLSRIAVRVAKMAESKANCKCYRCYSTH